MAGERGQNGTEEVVFRTEDEGVHAQAFVRWCSVGAMVGCPAIHTRRVIIRQSRSWY